MDGTLIDTEPLWGKATFELGELLGRPLTPEVRAKTIGGSFPNTLNVVAEWAGYELKDGDLERYRTWMFDAEGVDEQSHPIRVTDSMRTASRKPRGEPRLPARPRGFRRPRRRRAFRRPLRTRAEVAARGSHRGVAGGVGLRDQGLTGTCRGEFCMRHYETSSYLKAWENFKQKKPLLTWGRGLTNCQKDLETRRT